MAVSAKQLSSSISKLNRELNITNPKCMLNFHLLVELYLLNEQARYELNKIVWAHVNDEIPKPLEVV